MIETKISIKELEKLKKNYPEGFEKITKKVKEYFEHSKFKNPVEMFQNNNKEDFVIGYFSNINLETWENIIRYCGYNIDLLRDADSPKDKQWQYEIFDSQDNLIYSAYVHNIDHYETRFLALKEAIKACFLITQYNWNHKDEFVKVGNCYLIRYTAYKNDKIRYYSGKFFALDKQEAKQFCHQDARNHGRKKVKITEITKI